MAGRPELMERALREAERARGRTHPNPMVGCVIAKGDSIIATGYHARAGGPHAEVVALRRAGSAARGADVYVTLEPCDHHGRTGPCTQVLVQAGVSRVFVGSRDPNPIVDGRGLRCLRKAGIAVQVGLLGKACRRINEAYEHRMRTGRPFVVCKVAQSLDGRVATRSGESQWITGAAARQAGHRLRNELDGIIVGVGTVLADDPKLTCRIRGGRDPARIVLDTHARTSPRASIITVARGSEAPTWVVVGDAASVRRRRALERSGAETIACSVRQGRIDLIPCLELLAERGLLSVLVEGGPAVIGSLFDARLANRVVVFVAPLVIGGTGAISSVGGQGVARLADAARLRDIEVSRAGPDLMISGYPRSEQSE